MTLTDLVLGLGTRHPANDVLLRPSDASRLAESGAASTFVIERADGSLLLIGRTGGGAYVLAGEVAKGKWAWADPTKRQPAPLARVPARVAD